MLKQVVILTVYAALALAWNWSSGPRVTLKFGEVVGSTRSVDGGRVDQFLGIPYATPPINYLRFKRPQPYTGKWLKPLISDTWGYACPQVVLPGALMGLTANTSEDCLNLNIWTPHTGGLSLRRHELKPVMVFIHGGGFVFGSASSQPLDGVEISARANIVVVTLNYRLGPLGFFYGNSEGAPGNVGLWDQQLALQWIKENIQNFGGNPANITLSGQSAGGMSVGLHLMAPSSRGLFQRAIIMSGPLMNMLPSLSSSLALRRSSRLAKVVGCRKSFDVTTLTEAELECLRNVPTEKLILGQYDKEVTQEPGYEDEWAFRPFYGDQFSPVAPIEAIQRGQLNREVALLFGTLTNDGVALGVLFKTSSPLSSPEYMKYRAGVYINLEDELKERILTQDGNSTVVSNRTFATATTGVFVCPLTYLADELSDSTDVYQYYFSYPSTLTFLCTNISYRPCHGDEVFVLFAVALTNPVDKAASINWIKFITSFVKNETLPVPKYAKDGVIRVRPYYNYISATEQRVGTNFRGESCLFWNIGVAAGKVGWSV